ncbi:MAG TPA: alpha/beta fold hydrolase [Vicinamibacterales bacterium]|nr:alpha/beta fold hydrolase [Vicinamibacterales bacterium]
MNPGAPLARALAAVSVIIFACCVAPAAATGRLVNFSAADGTPLAGMLYEASDSTAPGIVLVHMLGRSKDEWAWLAERLRDEGATVLAMDLRGHGGSGGNGGAFAPMTSDVRAAIDWLGARPNVRANGLGVVGSSLGASVGALAAADAAAVRAVALISPSLDYRGVRLDSATMRKLSDRSVWMVASSEDPYALRTVHELAGTAINREPRISGIRGHGTSLLTADQDLARALVEWLKAALAF